MSEKSVNQIAVNYPFVSVLMPVRNEADFIERSLGAVLNQTYPHDRLEVIISDGESTDGTLAIVDKLAGGSQIPVLKIRNTRRIAPTALNLAIAQARGEIFVRVDGHCEIDPDYVANCVRHLSSGIADGVGGPIETIGIGHQAEAISKAMSSSFGVGGSAFRTVKDRQMYTDTVAFPGYTREIVERAGPFNEQLVRNQDDEYNYRIRDIGGKILLSPDIKAKYYSRSNFRSLWKQYFQYGYWKVRVFQLHPARMRVRQFVPLVFVLSMIVAALLTVSTTAGAPLLFLLVSAYSAFIAVGAIVTAKSRTALIPSLAASFAILHFSYGLGFLAGLIAVAGDWRGLRGRATAHTSQKSPSTE